MRRVRLATLGLLAVAGLVAGCVGSSSAIEPGSAIPADAVRLVAAAAAFEPREIEVPAGEPVTLVFENREGPPHNVHVRDGSGGTVFQGEIFGGPGIRVHRLPALAAGTYPFVCDVHPDMTGRLTAVEGG